MRVIDLIQLLGNHNPNSVVLLNVDEEDGCRSVDQCQLVAAHPDKADPSGSVGVILLSGKDYYHSVENAVTNIF